MTLDELSVGHSGVITQVGGEGILRCRLLDMGLIPHTKIRVNKIAPMGDPGGLLGGASRVCFIRIVYYLPQRLKGLIFL